MNHSGFGVRSCGTFAMVLLCLLGMGVAFSVVKLIPPTGGGEWRGLNHLPWGIGLLLCGVLGSALSLVGFSQGILGAFEARRIDPTTFDEESPRFILGLLGTFKVQRNARNVAIAAAIAGISLNGLVLLRFVCWIFGGLMAVVAG